MDTEEVVQALRSLCEREGGYRVVATAIGANPATLYQITAGIKLPSGKPRGVGRELRDKLTARYGDWLGQDKNVEAGPAYSAVVPLLSHNQAAMYKEFLDSEDVERIPVSAPVSNQSFAMRVVGSSMEPRFPEGTVIFIDPNVPAVHGDFVVAKNGGGEITFKRLSRDGGELYLEPLNPRFPVKPLGDAEIIGKVVLFQGVP